MLTKKLWENGNFIFLLKLKNEKSSMGIFPLQGKLRNHRYVLGRHSIVDKYLKRYYIYIYLLCLFLLFICVSMAIYKVLRKIS